MKKQRKADQKTLELKRAGTLNTRPGSVSDTLFKENPFFDPKDLLQVRYEMLRRHDVEGVSIVDVAAKFGVSRPTVYQAHAAFLEGGLSGLIELRGSRRPAGHGDTDFLKKLFLTGRRADAK